MYEHKDLTGSLFKNTKKEEGSKQPDFNGSCKIEGTEYWLSGWAEQSAKGTKYLSLKFQVKEERPEDKVEDSRAQAEEFF